MFTFRVDFLKCFIRAVLCLLCLITTVLVHAMNECNTCIDACTMEKFECQVSTELPKCIAALLDLACGPWRQDMKVLWQDAVDHVVARGDLCIDYIKECPLFLQCSLHLYVST